MSERVYWAVSPDSPVMKAIEEANETHRTFQRACTAFAKEFGAPRVFRSDTHLSGLDFDGDLPPGWRKNKNYAAPDKRKPLGREIAQRLRDLPTGVDGMRFSQILYSHFKSDPILEWTHFGDNHVYWTTFEKLGGQYILSVPAQSKIEAIPGCTELKMSEYWRIREATKATEAA